MKGAAWGNLMAELSAAVSVPLRGSGDESSAADNRLTYTVSYTFQSPCGEVVMKGGRRFKAREHP